MLGLIKTEVCTLLQNNKLFVSVSFSEFINNIASSNRQSCHFHVMVLSHYSIAFRNPIQGRVPRVVFLTIYFSDMRLTPSLIVFPICNRCSINWLNHAQGNFGEGRGGNALGTGGLAAPITLKSYYTHVNWHCFIIKCKVGAKFVAYSLDCYLINLRRKHRNYLKN